MAPQQDRLSCDKFNAWITVNGEALPQYGVEYKEANKEASCWIESAAGQASEFSVYFRKKSKDRKDYAVELFLDGQQVAYLIYESDKGNLDDEFIDRMSISATEVRKFVFAPLDLTDDDALLGNPCHKDVGNIKIVLREGISSGVSAMPPVMFPAPNAEKIHERSKKGLGHRVNLGPAISVPAPANWKGLIFNPSGEPFTCVFNYRPLSILQAAGIAPRIPNPEELPRVKPEVIEIDSSDDEEGREMELLAELEQVRKRKRVKQRNAPPYKKLKTEPINRFVHGEVIDLTL